MCGAGCQHASGRRASKARHGGACGKSRVGNWSGAACGARAGVRSAGRAARRPNVCGRRPIDGWPVGQGITVICSTVAAGLWLACSAYGRAELS
ncbi:hypothetical protein E2562_003091 [Oryza meyeriana var. granulata]|uniref:Uncharacterized protein n=1 Tax=Oryza meyeriana var. granulata TaxID=110450 RepID=A0A6G1E9N2_9ORYZ|nr:hypothetical protein E2562_003091 [Oryza meyeriana var. granulata]